MKTTVTIRAMQRQDAGAVVGMVQKLAAYHGDKTGLKKSFLLRHCFGKYKSIYIHIAFANGKPIGFAQCFDWTKIHRAIVDSKLDLLFIEDEWRSHGIGKKLTAYAAEAAIKRGCSRLQTSSALTNQDAKRFYLNLGFVQRSVHTIDYLIEGEALHALIKNNRK